MYWDHVTCDRWEWEQYSRKKESREYIEVSPKLFESMMGVMDYDVYRSGVELYYEKPDPQRPYWALVQGKAIYIYGRNRREHNKMLRFFQQQKRLQEKANKARLALKHNITLAELENFKKHLHSIEEGERKKRELLRDQYLEIADRVQKGG